MTCMGPSAAQEADGPLVVCPAFPFAVWQDGAELRIAIDFGGTWVEITRDGDHVATIVSAGRTRLATAQFLMKKPNAAA